jgi:hypothetical protein
MNAAAARDLPGAADSFCRRFELRPETPRAAVITIFPWNTFSARSARILSDEPRLRAP